MFERKLTVREFLEFMETFPKVLAHLQVIADKKHESKTQSLIDKRFANLLSKVGPMVESILDKKLAEKKAPKKPVKRPAKRK